MASSKGLRTVGSRLAVERMESRLLLTLYTGPSAIKPIVTRSAIYQATVTGGGFETIKRTGKGVYNVSLTGTTPASTFTIKLVHTRPHFSEAPIEIGQINVKSGQLGAIQALNTADLVGKVSPLNNTVSSIQLNGIGPNAKIDIHGNLGGLTAASGVALSPSGHVTVSGSMTGPLNVGGELLLNGGQIDIKGNVSAGVTVGSVTVRNGGSFHIGNNLNGGLSVQGSLDADSNGTIGIGGSLDTLSVSGNVALDTGGNFSIGGDATGALTVNQGMSLSNGSTFHVGRDVLQGLKVGGDLSLATGASINVVRSLTGLTVTGNLQVNPSGGAITVGGNLTNVTITGALQGKGNTTADLNVGLDLSNLNVLGGGADQGGVQAANINVAKNIVGLNLQHGIFRSLITAGVLIDGGTQSSTGGGNIGPDGTEAIYNSEIRAGVEINHLVINGDVLSDFPTNPNATGFPTRIIAGENRQGKFTAGGLIDHFQILGSMTDSVVAASVAPSGGNGTLPPSGYNPIPPIPNPGPSTYNAPFGTVAVGNFTTFTNVPNYTELSYFNETFTGVSWNPINPVLTNNILSGAINPSFASPPAVNSSISVTNSNGAGGSSSTTEQTVPASLAIPTTSTVLGGVTSTSHTNQFDFAGLLAADTSGVFIGIIPKQKG